MFPVESAFMSVNYLVAFKPVLILEVLQRSVMLLARESHLQLACFFSSAAKNESNFRSIKEFETRTSYLQPCVASGPMQ